MVDFFTEENCVLKICKLSETAKIPTKSSYFAAGFDLYSAHDYIICAKDKQICFTDIAIDMPFGSYGRISPRSGLASKFFLDVGAGVLDADYTGNIGVILFNFSNIDYEVKVGDKIAQLIVEKIYFPEIVEVDSIDKTDRGDNGFGSSGV